MKPSVPQNCLSKFLSPNFAVNPFPVSSFEQLQEISTLGAKLSPSLLLGGRGNEWHSENPGSNSNWHCKRHSLTSHGAGTRVLCSFISWKSRWLLSEPTDPKVECQAFRVLLASCWGTSMLVCSPCDPIGGVLVAECEDWLASHVPSGSEKSRFLSQTVSSWEIVGTSGAYRVRMGPPAADQ